MMSKKVVVVLVIIAIVLAGIAVGMNISDSGENVSTTDKQILEDDGQAKLRIKVLPPEVEDKNG